MFRPRTAAQADRIALAVTWAWAVAMVVGPSLAAYWAWRAF